MILWFSQRIRDAEFDPGRLGMLTNPFYFARRGLRKEIARMAPSLEGRLLDVGCGQKPYRELFNVDEYLGLEIDRDDNRGTKAADHYYDGKRMPFENDRFDAALCNQVLEHVFDAPAFLAEIHRVLRPGGKLLLTIPFVWNEHEKPWDFARYTTFGVRHLLEQSGFDVLEQCKCCGNPRALFQLANAYFVEVMRTRSRLLNALTCLVFIAPVNVLGELIAHIMPSNDSLFLDQLVLARRRPDAVSP